jgi:heavy metal translocating P-type ATPase
MAYSLDLEGNTLDLPVPEDLLIRWVVAFVASMLLIFLSLTIHFDETVPAFFPAFSFFLATGVFALISKELFLNLKREWNTRQFSLGSLITLGVSASYILSVVNWVRGSHLMYFETSAMILTFYVGSLLIDIYLKNKISEFTNRWQAGAPSVIAQKSSGQFERMSVTEISEGTPLKTEQDSSLPVDGVLESEKGYFREDHLTGEPKPILKYAGDSISAGSVPMEDDLLVSTTSTYDSSSLQQYYRKHELTRQEVSTYELFAYRAAQILLVAVSILALGTGVYYGIYSDIQTTLSNALSVLLIGCPCAFAIATPAALWIVQNKLEEGGILLRTGTHAIEQLAKVKQVVFDKTGTLTQDARINDLNVHSDAYSKRQLLGLLGGLEATQQHPIAEAVRNYLKKEDIEDIEVNNVQPIQGLGIEGVWQKSSEIRYSVQLLNSVHKKARDLTAGTFGLFVEDQLVMSFRVHYPLKKTAVAAMNKLVSDGFEVSVLTGDPEPNRELQNKGWTYHSGLTPEEKQKLIQKMNQEETLCYIGDGINDLLAMAEADIAIAMFDGANKSKTTADLVLFNPNFDSIPKILDASARSGKIIRLNFFWASIYNITGLSLAVMGFLNPLISILAMVLSSAFVTANSLRLRNLRFTSQ